jgi:hypothetical protein
MKEVPGVQSVSVNLTGGIAVVNVKNVRKINERKSKERERCN